ncbi:hypothetical protein FGB62_33g180 [Gracilaria domingensis]|nr:hypothetical protein FGB62_33g180 [Gracilaria domingensis]
MLRGGRRDPFEIDGTDFRLALVSSPVALGAMRRGRLVAADGMWWARCDSCGAEHCAPHHSCRIAIGGPEKLRNFRCLLTAARSQVQNTSCPASEQPECNELCRDLTCSAASVI